MRRAGGAGLPRAAFLLPVTVVRQLLDVVHQAVELPLRIDFLAAAQGEAVQPLVCPKVAEHRFDGGEAPAVEFPPAFRIDPDRLQAPLAGSLRPAVSAGRDGCLLRECGGLAKRRILSLGAIHRMENEMRKTKIVQWSAAVLIFWLGVATGLVAQIENDSPQRKEQKRADLSGAPGMEVIASTAEYKEGEAIDLHFHHGIEAAYVVQGATVQSPGKDPVPLPTGASLLNLRDVKHGGFKVVGATPLKLFTVHIVDKGKPLYDYSK